MQTARTTANFPLMSGPQQRKTLMSCLVGDWVAAESVREWKTLTEPQRFTEPAVVVRSHQKQPGQGTAFPDAWVFVPDTVTGADGEKTSVWRRES